MDKIKISISDLSKQGENESVLRDILNAKDELFEATGTYPNEIKLGRSTLNSLKKEVSAILGIKHPYILTEIYGMKIKLKRVEK